MVQQIICECMEKFHRAGGAYTAGFTDGGAIVGNDCFTVFAAWFAERTYNGGHCLSDRLLPSSLFLSQAGWWISRCDICHPYLYANVY